MSASRQPNVLLFITDQQRWDSMGYTGRTACRTPNLDRLAREGTVFDRCLTADPICCPSRAAIFTGRFPHATGVCNNYQLPLERPTLPEAFHAAGYHVAYSGKWHLGRGRAAAALEGWLGERGDGHRRWLAEHHFPDTYPYGTPEFSFRVPGADEDPNLLQRSISSPRTGVQPGLTEWTYDGWVAGRALESLETRPKDQPFFHVCSFHGPHPVFVIPEPYYSLYDPNAVPEPANFADPKADKPDYQTSSIWAQDARAHGTTWEAWRKSQAVYWGYVTMLDEFIGRVLGRLESLGLTENTIVAMISDHGEQMGSHGLFQKSTMYEEALRVPFLVRAPGQVPSGGRVRAPVSLTDLAPTLLGLSGLSEAGRTLLEPQGRDLTGWLTGQVPVPPETLGASDDPAAGAVFSEYTPYAGEGMTDLRCVVGPRYKYVWSRDDRDELYDTWIDPGELSNRIDDPSLGRVRERLQVRLRDWARETADPLADSVATG